MVDSRKEHNAVREANALGIPTIALLDTDSDPEEVTIPIAGNDDSMRSIAVVIRYLADAVEEGLKGRPPEQPAQAEGAEAGPTVSRRRSRAVALTLAEAPSGPAAAPAPVGETAGQAATVAEPAPTEPVPDGG